MNIVVTGAGGFIGHHLTNRLVRDGHIVIGVDIKPPEFEPTSAQWFRLEDLRDPKRAKEPFRYLKIDQVYMLAADMGGMGFIKGHDAQIMVNNQLININTLMQCNTNHVKRVLYTSSACIYPVHKQTMVDAEPLREEDAYPANPEDGYGWEKLTTEKLCQYFGTDYQLDTRVARFHNIFGPQGAWTGGREKAPAALCRKVAHAKLTGDRSIDIWGDGQQTRSFCYIDDCVEGLIRLMASDEQRPLNIGSDRMISINDLVNMIMWIADYHCKINHIDGPQGVRGRNSDNTNLRKTLGWEPAIALEEGLARTYAWVEQQVEYALEKR